MKRTAFTACALSGLIWLGTGTAQAEPGNLGTNLTGVSYWDGAVPFSDLVKQAGDWIGQSEGAGWGQGPAVALRTDGWPARLSSGQYATLVLADVHYPAGTYQVSWLGTGRFDINGKSFSGPIRSGTVQLDGSSTVTLNIRSTSPADPVRRIQVRRGSGLFRSAYLTHLSPYSTLRFMDWQRTNAYYGEPRRRFTCANRVSGGYVSQGTSRGVSTEVMVKLANRLHADPWFTIPHEATDDWLRCHARVVARSLDRSLVPRYEFSNETWNPAFRTYSDLRDEAQRLGLGGGDEFLGVQILTAQRHNHAMDVVGAVMKNADRPFIRVLSGQAANSWVLEQRLATRGTRSRTDEMAIAPYLGVTSLNPFDPSEARVIARWSRDRLFTELAGEQGTVDVWVRDHVDLARRSGTRLVTYEGGQHLAGDSGNGALTTLFTGANRDPRMGAVYRTYLARWKSATGNALFMHFSDVGEYSRYGSWGALEWPEQTSSPKYDALLEYVR